MKSTNAEIKLQQRRNSCKDGTESSTKSSSLPWSCSASSTTDSLYLGDYTCDNCDGEGCTDCGNYGFYLGYWPKMKKRARDAKFSKSLFMLFPDEKDARPPRTNETSKKIMTKSKNELLKDYCPYSSDNCGCSSGCTDCDYGLYTYTTKNKSKLKSKAKRVYVRSSNGFRPLKASERTALSLSTRNVLRKKKAKFPKMGKTLKNYYPESFDSCDRKSGYRKRDSKLHITRDRILKTKKKTRNSGKPKTTRTVRILKLLSSKKVLNKAAATVSERDVAKNWFSDSFHSCECNSDCTECKKHVITKRKKLKNRSKRARTSVHPRISVKNEVSKQTARICPKRRTSWSSCDYSESESYFTGEDC